MARRRQYQATYEAAVSQYKQTVLAAFQNVADTLVSLEEDSNTLAEVRRAADAAQALQQDSESKYQLGSIPLFTALAARQQFQSANVQYVRARAARLADSAALFDAMGDPARRTATAGTRSRE
jgi:outer membrane protein TolC